MHTAEPNTDTKLTLSSPPSPGEASFATKGSRCSKLSVRETTVLACLALGKSGREVARILEISVCTVRAHVRNITRKLNASNIPHAVAEGFRAGILER
jgi:DNA-binding CsgD family transcriptional regulator